MGPSGSPGERPDRFFSTGLGTVGEDGDHSVCRASLIKIEPAEFGG